MSTYTEERTARHALEDARDRAIVALALYLTGPIADLLAEHGKVDYPIPADVLAALCPGVPTAKVLHWFEAVLHEAAMCPDHLQADLPDHPAVIADVEYMTGARR